MKIALIAPPWPFFNRPSIQIASLKAYCKKVDPEILCTNLHPYLRLYQRIGQEQYGLIAQSSWASEAIGAMLITQGYETEQCRLAERAIGKRGQRGRIDCAKMRDALKWALDSLLDEVDWESHECVGITISLNQLTSAIYLSRAIKAISPKTQVVLGGAGVPEEVGKDILDAFESVDYVISGEGEKAFLQLLKAMKAGKQPPRSILKGDPIDAMDSLPTPDFSDYFKEISELPPKARFFPILPIEFSRGCFWGRCTFCNLNVQWKGYRKKSWQRMLMEVDDLTRRHDVLDFAFMDNALPLGESMEFFRAVSSLKRDYRFFAELRASFSRRDAFEMRRAGLKTVQVGVEALSSSLLKRLSKGRSVMDNIAAMRHLLEAGIELQGNLILDFPGSTEKEVDETLKALEFCLPFRPLNLVSFWLGYGSPVYRKPSHFGIRLVRPHRNYRVLFPSNPLRTPMVYEYRGNCTRERRIWRPVRKAVKAWKAFWNRASQDGLPLSFRDGMDFLIIRQVTPTGKTFHHRLKGLSRKIFLFCLEPRPMEEVFERFSTVSRDSIFNFLNDLKKKRLVYKNREKVLALPIKTD